MVTDERNNKGIIRRACYLDAALVGNTGHHANVCRHIAGEFRRRGIEVDILANAAVESGLSEEFGAIPTFLHFPYCRITSKKLINLALERASLLTDLRSAVEGGRYDFYYVSSVLPSEMAAMIHWGQTRFSAANMPPIIMEFGLPSGVGVTTASNWGRFTEQYRSAASQIRENYSGKFLFFTFDPAASSDYSGLIGLDVETLPAVYTGGEIRLRTGDEQGRPVVGFLGHQRPEKGYDLLPDLMRLLLAKDVGARFLIHNGDSRETATDRELRELAAADPRVCFDQQPADKSYWNRLLDSTDIVALPYDPLRYTASVSAVAVEAISCGLPIVCPKGTTMKVLAERYQNSSIAISKWSVEAVAEAIFEAVRNFPGLARSAYEGVDRWAHENGAPVFASRVLDFVEEHRPTQPSSPSQPFEPIMRGLGSVAQAKLKLRESTKRRRERRRRVS